MSIFNATKDTLSIKVFLFISYRKDLKFQEQICLTTKSLENSNNNYELFLYNQPIKVSKYITPYNPQNLNKFYDNFKIIKTIVPNGLSPTIINIAMELNNNKLFALKELKKEKFKNPFNNEFARSELIIHYSLSKLSSNIVNVVDYYEDDKAYYLLMEYCEEANYFEEILENVGDFLYFLVEFFLLLLNDFFLISKFYRTLLFFIFFFFFLILIVIFYLIFFVFF